MASTTSGFHMQQVTGGAGARAGRGPAGDALNSDAGRDVRLAALRKGPLLDAALRALPPMPEVLLVKATGRDHPRSPALAL